MATDGIKKSLKGSNFVLITGDITDQGRAGEWSQFHNLLASLDSPLDSGRVMMVPGNHDLSLVTSHNPSTMARIAYDRNAYRFISAVLSKCPPGWTMHTPDGFISVRGYLEEVAEYLDCYGRHPPYARGAPPHGNLDVWFPEELVAAYDKLNKPLWPNRRWQMCHDFLRLAYPMVFLDNDKYLIVGLNSCDEVAETIFDSAIGRLGDGQIKRLKTILSNAGARTVIILMHHHLGIPEEVWELMRRDQSALAIRSLALRDASKLQRILANVTNCIVFHGHKHVGYYAQVGKTLVVSGPSITFPDRYALAKSDRYVLGADGLKAFS